MTAGFAVSGLRLIDTASWRPADGDEERDRTALFKSLVMIGAGDSRRMVYQVDLLAEVAAFYDPKHGRVSAARGSAAA